MVKRPQLGRQQLVNLKCRDVGVAGVPWIIGDRLAPGEPQNHEVFARVDLDLQSKGPHLLEFQNRTGKPAIQNLRPGTALASPANRGLLDRSEDGADRPSFGLDKIDVVGVATRRMKKELVYAVPPRKAIFLASLASEKTWMSARVRTKSCSTWASSGHGALARHAVMFAWYHVSTLMGSLTSTCQRRSSSAPPRAARS